MTRTDRFWSTLMELEEIGAYDDEATGLRGVREHSGVGQSPRAGGNGVDVLANAPIVSALLAAAGPGTTTVPLSYWADSAFLSAAGIPTVLYGPEGDGAHADVEWVSRSGTLTAADVLTRLARDFCS
ncbi:M20/M25/M40 family metallo-hydrolase [Dactylosporangium salmoneum]|uniref:M20/M25/M40 family metallo-hydrolase n=1 Tax=Dactylosporangium salmoneum TaxID=53361 RepID=A0ABN3I2U3_9ACTN